MWGGKDRIRMRLTAVQAPVAQLDISTLLGLHATAIVLGGFVLD